MANWQQKLSKSITGIKGVDRNVAELTIRIDSLDDFFGNRPPRIIELHRELIIAAPELSPIAQTSTFYLRRVLDLPATLLRDPSVSLRVKLRPDKPVSIKHFADFMG